MWILNKHVNFKLFFILGLFPFELFLLALPLTNSLDFEFSVTNSLIFSFFSTILALNFDSIEKLKKNFRFIVFAFLFPFILGVLYTILFSECPLTANAFYYLLFVLPAGIFGYSLGYIIQRLFSRFKYGIIIAFYLLILLQTLADIFYFPQVYSYNQLFGFFPGTIYDEYLPITSANLLFGLFTLLCAGALLLLSRISIVKNFGGAVRIFVILIAASLIYFAKINVGFCTTESDLHRELPNSVVTEHFVVNYPSGEDENFGRTMARLHEYYFANLSDYLGSEPAEKIHSYIFRDKYQKQRLFGAGNADVAKPWLNQIYIQRDSYGSTLKHELAHLFLANEGATIFKVADGFNPALIEGYAMALENDFAGHDIDDMAALARNEGFDISIPELFSGFSFFGSFSSLAYIYAGSFIKYLFENYPAQKVLSLYSNSDFSGILGKSIDSLEIEYNSFLDTVEPKFRKSAAKLYFGHKPIFEKICPRVAAAEMIQAAEVYRDSNYKKAAEKYEDLFAYSGSFQSLRGWTASEIKLRKYGKISEILEQNAETFSESAFLYSFYILMGDAAVFNGDSVRADSLYSRIIQEYPTVDFLAAAQFRKTVLELGFLDLSDYFKSDSKEKLKFLIKLNTEQPIPASIPNLLAHANDDDQLIELFKRISSDFKCKDILSQNAAIKIGDWLIERDRTELAEKYFGLAAEYNSPYFSKVIFDRLSLIRWINSNRVMLRKAKFYDDSDD